MKQKKLVYEIMSKRMVISTFGMDYYNSLGIPNDELLMILFPSGRRTWYGDKRPTKQFVKDVCEKEGILFVTK